MINKSPNSSGIVDQTLQHTSWSAGTQNCKNLFPVICQKWKPRTIRLHENNKHHKFDAHQYLKLIHDDPLPSILMIVWWLEYHVICVRLIRTQNEHCDDTSSMKKQCTTEWIKLGIGNAIIYA
jgi:hypothetical protein